MKKVDRRVIFAAALVLAPLSAVSHHSLSPWNIEELREYEGVITSVSWRNPHSSLSMQILDESGEPTDWALETGSISEIRAHGVSLSDVAPGDHVRIAGYSSRRGRQAIFVRNILLLETNRELLLTLNSNPYFSTNSNSNSTLVTQAIGEQEVEEARLSATGMFRVWSTIFSDPEARLLKGEYPLSESAQAVKDSYDAEGDSPFAGCAPKGMPHIMASPMPMELLEVDGDILIRIEEYDTERRIHMTPDTDDPPGPHSLLGYSKGRWEGSTLVVETVDIASGWLDQSGTRLSDALSTIERFNLSEDESRLDYVVTLIDADALTEPLNLSRFWTWIPGVYVDRWDCEVRE